MRNGPTARVPRAGRAARLARAALLTALVVGAIALVRSTLVYRPVVVAQAGSYGAVRFGYAVRDPDYLGLYGYWYYFQWRSRRYFVWDSPEPPRASEIEVRISDDGKGVWVVEHGPWTRVLCSIDLSTGEYVSLNGFVVSPDCPRGRYDQGVSHCWATEQSGHPLATVQTPWASD